MSRVVITNNFSPQDFQPSHSTTPLKRKKPQPLVSSPRSRALSISRHVKAAIEYTTSQDLYLQKSQAILSVANKEKDLTSYLKEHNIEKENPRFLHQKINHMAKIVNANGEKDEEIFSGIGHRLYEKRNSSLSIMENTSLMDRSIRRDYSKDLNKPPSDILLQKRYNQILYSENYIERLKDRYKKYRANNLDLQRNLAETIKRHWEELLKEKENKAKKKVGEIEKMLDGDEEQIAAMHNTKAGFRFKTRMEKLHQKRYMSLWSAHGLPSVGNPYILKRDEKKYT